MAGRAPDQRAQAGQNLLQIERFGDIIVGPGVEARDLLAPAVARGQDQHRHIVAGTAPAFQNGDPVHHRQAEIEHHGIVALGLAEELRLLAVMGLIDRVAGLGQRGRELAREIGIVLHHEQSHYFCPLTSMISPVAALA